MATEERESSRREIQDLRDEVERYRQATEDALQQLDWCIGFLHGSGKRGLASSLAKNRAHIRKELMQRSEQPVPSQHETET